MIEDRYGRLVGRNFSFFSFFLSFPPLRCLLFPAIPRLFGGDVCFSESYSLERTEEEGMGAGLGRFHGWEEWNWARKRKKEPGFGGWKPATEGKREMKDILQDD